MVDLQLLLPVAATAAGPALSAPLHLFELHVHADLGNAGGRSVTSEWRSLSCVVSSSGELLAIEHSATGVAASDPLSLGFAVAGHTKWRALRPGEAVARFGAQPTGMRLLYGCSITGLANVCSLRNSSKAGVRIENDQEGDGSNCWDKCARVKENDEDFENSVPGPVGRTKEVVLLLRSREDLDLLRVELSRWLSPSDSSAAAKDMATAAPTSISAENSFKIVPNFNSLAGGAEQVYNSTSTSVMVEIEPSSSHFGALDSGLADGNSIILEEPLRSPTVPLLPILMDQQGEKEGAAKVDFVAVDNKFTSKPTVSSQEGDIQTISARDGGDSALRMTALTSTAGGVFVEERDWLVDRADQSGNSKDFGEIADTIAAQPKKLGNSKSVVSTLLPDPSQLSSQQEQFQAQTHQQHSIQLSSSPLLLQSTASPMLQQSQSKSPQHSQQVKIDLKGSSFKASNFSHNSSDRAPEEEILCEEDSTDAFFSGCQQPELQGQANLAKYSV